MFKRLIAIILVILAASAGGADAFWSQNAKPQNIGDISVVVIDDAIGGCWTNMSAVASYAEEKLKARGYQIETTDEGYKLLVRVTAYRIKPSGICVGQAYVEVNKPIMYEGVFGYHRIGSAGKVATSVSNGNLNDVAIEVIDDIVGEITR